MLFEKELRDSSWRSPHNALARRAGFAVETTGARYADVGAAESGVRPWLTHVGADGGS